MKDIIGVAERISDLGEGQGWNNGTSLYRLSPPLKMPDNILYNNIVTIEYVVVSVTPYTIDHGQPETKVFVTTETGELQESKTLDDPNVDIVEGTVVGFYDHTKALQQIGYKIKNPSTNKTQPPNFIFQEVHDAVLASVIEDEMFNLVGNNIFEENKIIWTPFPKLNTFQKLSVKPGDKHFGYKVFWSDGYFWNEDFSAKNGRIEFFFYVDPSSNILSESEVKINGKRKENEKVVKKGCLFSIFNLK